VNKLKTGTQHWHRRGKEKSEIIEGVEMGGNKRYEENFVRRIGIFNICWFTVC